MFNKLISELKKLENGVQVQLSLPDDEDGYFDRKCPESLCEAEFKILSSDWTTKVGDQRVFCPVCRHEAPATEWNTNEQTEYIEALAVAHVKQIINDALRDDAVRFNRQQRPGFIQLSLHVSPTPTSVILPVNAANIMRQKFTCDVCGCKYAAIGTAFFCPACGHNSAITTFQQTVDIVRTLMSMAPSIRSTLASAYDENIAQNSVRNTVEDSLGRLVATFQRVTEAMFEQLPNASSFKRRKNVFQNLSEGSTLWRNATGSGYENMLSPTEFSELEMLFQKRHLIAHRDGIVDQEYIDKSGDKTYTVGQRLVISEAQVIRLAELVSKLATELQKLV